MVLLIIPPIISVAIKNKLFDEHLEDRRVHNKITPNGGGIAIFIGFLFSCLVFIPFNLLPQANVLMAAALIIFIVGFTDDIDSLAPFKKLIAQTAASVMAVILADIRIDNFYGFFGMAELTYNQSVALSIFCLVGLINAFNLIDGIDGLAGCLGVLLGLLYAFLFYNVGELGYAYLSIALTGALVGFLYFNFTPAKIFMGDSGSLLLGFVIAIISIRLLRFDTVSKLSLLPIPINSALALVASTVILPVFDTLRVFTLRILKGVSPFTADTNHLHHLLLKLGLRHIASTFILVSMNLFFILLTLIFQGLGNTVLIILMLVFMLSINSILSLCIAKYLKSKQIA
jgi:UDP-GlcNAc:undecaprenyl-phosphate GlcNAc-1-phosphate transferase